MNRLSHKILTHAAVRGVVLVSTMMTGHDEEHHTDGPIVMACVKSTFLRYAHRWIWTYHSRGNNYRNAWCRLYELI